MWILLAIAAALWVGFAWADFPLEADDEGVYPKTEAEQWRVLASAIKERLALVGLSDTNIDDIIDTADDDLIADQEVLTTWLAHLRGGVNSALTRYYDSDNTAYTLSSLRSDAGLSGTNWLRVPARYNDGTPTYGAVQQNDRIVVEHLNELVTAVKQLKRIRFVGTGTINYANHNASYIKTYVPTDWPTAQENAYDDTAGNAIATGTSTSRVLGRSCDSTDWTYYYDYYRVRYTLGSLYLQIDFATDPTMADLDVASLTYANKEVVVDLTATEEEFAGTPQLAIRMGTGTSAPSSLPGGGSLVGTVAWSDGEKTLADSGVVLPGAPGDDVTVYLQEDDYDWADTDSYPSQYGSLTSNRFTGIDNAESVEAYADVTNLTYT